MRRKALLAAATAAVVGLTFLWFSPPTRDHHWSENARQEPVESARPVGGVTSSSSAGERPPASNLVASRPSSRPLPSKESILASLWRPHEDAEVAAPAQNPSQMLHDRMVAEPIDSNWSANIEPNIKGFLEGQAAANFVDVVSIECRSSVCEVLAAGKSPDVADQAVDLWQQAVFAGSHQDWWSGYGLRDVSTSIAMTPDGQTLFATYFTTTRIKPPPVAPPMAVPEGRAGPKKLT